jgi:hypothetical protein
MRPASDLRLTQVRVLAVLPMMLGALSPDCALPPGYRCTSVRAAAGRTRAEQTLYNLYPDNIAAKREWRSDGEPCLC